MPAMGELLISADSHVVEPHDLWLDALPATLRDRAPRAVQDPGNHHWYFEMPGHPRGVDLTLSRTAGISNAEVARRLAEDPHAWIGARGGHDPHERLRDLWADGVHADVLYPTAGLSLLQLDDAPFQAACLRAYNDWLASFCAADPDRLLGIALLPLWDIDEGVRELERAKGLGLRGGLFWTSPPADRQHSFFSDHYEKLWAAAAALDMPLSIHILAGHRTRSSVAKFGTSVEDTFYFGFESRDEVQRSIVELIAAGVFQRHPRLNIVAAEAGIDYTARLERRIDSTFGRFLSLMDTPLTEKPSHYFRTNVWCTYISDPIGLNNLRFTGADHFLWSSDYPHGSATWPDSRATIARECAEFGIDDDTRRKLTCTNAARLYGIDLDVVAQPSPLVAGAVTPR
jgi:predicted TIM-barrel fold metal-dependent hydrolase